MQCLEPTGVEIGFWAANIQSWKEKNNERAETEGHVEKGDSESWQKWRPNLLEM